MSKISVSKSRDFWTRKWLGSVSLESQGHFSKEHFLKAILTFSELLPFDAAAPLSALPCVSKNISGAEGGEDEHEKDLVLSLHGKLVEEDTSTEAEIKITSSFLEFEGKGTISFSINYKLLCTAGLESDLAKLSVVDFLLLVNFIPTNLSIHFCKYRSSYLGDLVGSLPRVYRWLGITITEKSLALHGQDELSAGGKSEPFSELKLDSSDLFN